MLKITTIASSPNALRVRLEGKLVAEWIAELTVACAAGGPVKAIEVDVGGLLFADAEGIEALRQLAHQGLQITGCSPFITELLREKKQ